MNKIVNKIDKYNNYVNKCKLLGLDYFGGKINLDKGTLEVYKVYNVNKGKKLEIPSIFEGITDKSFSRFANIADINSIEGDYIGDNVKELCINDNIEYIGELAFCGMEGVNKIKIDARYVGDGAFTKCSDINKVHIGKNVRELGKDSFSGCKSITDLKIEDGLEIIEEYAFWRCGLDKGIKLPSTLKHIGKQAFSENRFKKVEISEGVEYLGDRCFLNCDYLEYIEIPDSVKYIGEGLLGGRFIKDSRLIKIKCNEYIFDMIVNDYTNRGKFERVL